MNNNNNDDNHDCDITKQFNIENRLEKIENRLENIQEKFGMILITLKKDIFIICF